MVRIVSSVWFLAVMRPSLSLYACLVLDAHGTYCVFGVAVHANPISLVKFVCLAHLINDMLVFGVGHSPCAGSS